MNGDGDKGRRGETAEDGASYWLARLQAEDIDEEDLRRFSAWREADPAHSETYDRFQNQWDRLATASSAPGIVDLRLDALSLLPAKRRFDWRQLGSMAAIFVLLLAGIVTLAIMQRPFGDTGDAGSSRMADVTSPDGRAAAGNPHFANSYSTGVGQRTTFRLADGSTVDLNTNSLVEIDYSKAVRRINLLRGEALFHVAKDPARPFIVEALGERVTALGTVFMVRRDEDRTLVVLLEGEVKVDRLSAESEGSDDDAVEVARLSPGQQLTYVDEKNFSISRADLSSIASWREGRLTFDDDRLSEVVAEVNRYSVQQLVIGDSAAGNLRISGTFHTGSAENFAQLLTHSFPVEVVSDKATNDLIVKRRGQSK